MFTASIDFRCISLDPTEHGGVTHIQPALTHHLLDITIRKLIPAIPSNAQKYYGRLEMTPLEQGLILLQKYDSKRM